MTTIETFGQLLSAASSQYLIYDMGRRVQPIEPQEFQQIETLNVPYPYPIQGHACFALVFWQQHNAPFIWFLKLPLDEQGFISPAGRQQFITMLLEAMGKDLQRPLTESQQQQLANHPFSFRPAQEKLALFNAQVRYQLGQAASVQYEFACQYLAGDLHSELWQAVGLQGLADICARAQLPEHTELLIRGVSGGRAELRIALCQLLEHIQLPMPLADAITTQLRQIPTVMQPFYIRALASEPQRVAQQLLAETPHTRLTEELLLAIAARCWLCLKQAPCLNIFLESLALQSQPFFNRLFADIVAIPAIRPQVLAALRNPQRSDQLSSAIDGLFRTVHPC